MKIYSILVTILSFATLASVAQAKHKSDSQLPLEGSQACVSRVISLEKFNKIKAQLPTPSDAEAMRDASVYSNNTGFCKKLRAKLEQTKA